MKRLFLTSISATCDPGASVRMVLVLLLVVLLLLLLLLLKDSRDKKEADCRFRGIIIWRWSAELMVQSAASSNIQMKTEDLVDFIVALHYRFVCTRCVL